MCLKNRWCKLSITSPPLPFRVFSFSFSERHCVYNFYVLFQHTKDFPLYTEAIKFFNHSESMVRIAVRTLTLNVYKVPDSSMLRFIRDRYTHPFVYLNKNYLKICDRYYRSSTGLSIYLPSYEIKYIQVKVQIVCNSTSVPTLKFAHLGR